MTQLVQDRPTGLEPAEQLEVDPGRTAFVESLLDNLPAWALIAAAIAFLYLVWATLEILSRYVGGFPKVMP